MRTKTKVVAVLLALVVLAGVGSAALLTYYGKLVGTSDLVQSVLVNGKDWTTIGEYTIGSVAGNIYMSEPFPIKNQAEISAYVSFDTLPEANYHVGQGFVNANDPDVTVTTTYFGELTLENKNPIDWSVITTDDISATLVYTLQGDEFGYDLDGTVPLIETEYALIYYMDQQNRFVNWGGEPGAVIAIATSETDGSITMSGSTDLESDLPFTGDWNTDKEADYGVAPDNYRMRTGAKLWLVPTSNLKGGNLPMVAWNPTTYLFETDLIAYHDTTDGEGCGLRIGANSEIDMYIENEFVINAKPGAYKITTTVVPETSCPLAQ